MAFRGLWEALPAARGRITTGTCGITQPGAGRDDERLDGVAEVLGGVVLGEQRDTARGPDARGIRRWCR